jgi:hypothetical protein
LAAGLIHNWDEMATKFLKNFFPAHETKKLGRKSRTSNKKMETFSSRHGSTLMGYFSNAHITMYLKTIRYNPSIKV